MPEDTTAAGIKSAFENIRAGEALKNNTLNFLRKEIESRNNTKKSISFRRFAIPVISAAGMFFAALFAFTLYFTPSSYVDMDVNPSVELALNRFGRVIDSYAYNADGGTILEGAGIKHKKYDAALGILVDRMIQEGFVDRENLISVTVQSEGGEDETLLAAIKSALRRHHETARIDAFSVDGELREAAHDMQLTPAKYLAIQELLEVDPTATVEGCRNHSIGEIRRMAGEHTGAGSHHGGTDGTRHH